MKRGHLLQALFRQSRLVPRPIAYNMGWLVALNEGWLNELDSAALQTALDAIASHAPAAPSLSAPREQWGTAVADWLGRQP